MDTSLVDEGRAMTKRVLLLCLLACCACSKNAPQAPATPAAPAASATPAAAPAAAATTAKAAAPAPAAEDRVFGVEELDQMVAPIALYPDPLLAQVLMAATYPGDVADAAKWAAANPKANGDAAVRQVADQPWDPSVQSLAAFPQVLATLGQDPGWVQKLGDAFLAQPDDVMDAVQRLRHKAKDAGNLDSNQYQKVSVQPAAAPAAGAAPAESAPMEQPSTGAYETSTAAGSTDTIVIQSADPQVVYVPSYNPTTAYGTWAYPSYPPAYYPPPAGYYAGSALVRGLAWGTGMAIAGSLWGDMDWGGNDININTSSYNSFNSNRQINSGTWQHNAANRDGVPYRDRNSRENYGNRLGDSASRDRMRGDDPARARSREQARQSMDRRGMEGPARTNREAQQRAQNAGRELGGREPGGREGAGRANAGAGNRDAQRAQAQRAAQNRGAENRGAQNRAGGAQNRPGAAGAGNRQAGAGNRQATPERHRQQGANNNASRDAARRQQQQRQSPRNDAFSGARQPQQSRQAAQRGQASQQRSRQQGGGGRQQASHQVNRQPHSGGGQRSGGAQRSSGGAQRSSGGAQRSGGNRGGGGHRR
ncbi:DUF3300 domain-containing protein [Lysobacter sp. KIS68-7]|uniref:DUF3300 domain-containing protein n=1 Tax=Lysobacter sp. KIS68-7 TaxID=2904252 RepID=UPI001E39C831|nr:DUF3300 domain-containing protein [Lysobacter sp. KIS68-7]UHQ18729.1 DUF3300 domain-containing protein [Lysobacter sp. KIS68-7]